MTQPGFDPSGTSVIVPLFNAGKFVGEAIDSILKQTLPVTEIIVVDDGSQDDGPRVAAARDRVRVISKEHSGISSTLNRGIIEARCGFLAFLDADDRWLPGKHALQMTALRLDPSLDMVYGDARNFIAPADGSDGPDEFGPVVPGMVRSAFLFRRASFMRVGLFSEDPRANEFMDWTGRARDAGLVSSRIGEVVFERRIHGSNFGIVFRERERRQYLWTLKQTLDRRRKAGPQPSTQQDP